MIRQKNMAAWGRAYFPYISIYKTLKIFFSETNGPISIQLGRNVKIVQAVMIHQKLWPLGGGAYFPYISI